MKFKKLALPVMLSLFCLLTFTALNGAANPWFDQGATPAIGQSANPRTAAPLPQLSSEDRADIFMARKEYADAVDYYFRALKQAGPSSAKDSELWNKTGIAYQQQGYFDAARKAYKRSIRDDKTFAAPWNNLGTTYFLVNKFGKSAKYYRHALVLKPDSASFLINLGTSYYRMRKYQQAVDDYRQALTIDPNILTERSETGSVVEARSVDMEYFYYMAKVFASLGRAQDAVHYLRRAFEDGFRNTKRLDQDPDFLKISKDPSYIALRENPPVAIKD